VVGGQPFVVPDGAPVPGDPRQCPLDRPAARQDFEDMQVIGALDDLDGELEAVLAQVTSLPA